MKLNPNYTRFGKHLCFFLFLLFFASTTNAQLTIVTQPVSSTLTACQDAPFGIIVKNLTPGSHTFSVVITLNPIGSTQDQVIDTGSITVPSGIGYAFSNNNTVLTFTTAVSMADSTSDTLKYSIKGLGCVPYITAHNYTQTISVVDSNRNSTTYTGSGGVQFSPGAINVNNKTLTYANSTPLLTVDTPSASRTIPVAAGGTGTFQAHFINSGPTTYQGTISVTQTSFCSDVTVKAIRLYTIPYGVAGASPVLVDTARLPITYPVEFCTIDPANIGIQPSQRFYIEEQISVSPNICMVDTGCKSTLQLNWGCSTPCTGTGSGSYCHALATTLSVLPTPAGFDVRALRILPTPSPATMAGGSVNPYAWEATCHGSTDTNQSENEWKYLIVNDGPSTATNVQLSLYNQAPGGISNTLIRSKSVHINEPDATLGVTAISPTYIHKVQTTLLDANFGHANPQQCYDTLLYHYPTDTAVKSIYFTIDTLVPGQRLVLDFKTYRCCASDNTPNVGVYYNHWVLYTNSKNPCGVSINCTTAPSFSPDTISLSPLVRGYYAWTSRQNYGGRGISLDYPNSDNSPDLTLTQVFLPEKLSIVGGMPTGCGDSSFYHITNKYFTNTSPGGGDDFDAMLFSSLGTAGGGGMDFIGGMMGANPQGQFVVDFNLGGSSIQMGSTVSIIKGGYTWNSYSLTTTATGMRAVFRLVDIPPAASVVTSYDLRNFIVGSDIGFWFRICCPINNVTNPTVTITTSFNPMPGSCAGCIIPLAQVAQVFNLYCPGCVTPGIIADGFTLRRTNVGLVDSNNDRLPESNTVITPAYSKYNLVNLHCSVIGDSLQAIATGYMKDGDGTNGFNLSQWQTALNDTNLFSDFYLEQNIVGSDVVGLTCTSATFSFKHNSVWSTPVAITAPTRVGTKLLFHVAAGPTTFNTRLIEGDRFNITAQYQACTNPTATVDMTATNIMYVTKGAETNPFPFYNGVKSPKDYIDSFHHGILGADTVAGASTPPIFWCEGYGGIHHLYPLTTSYTETWADYNGCTKQLAITVKNQIGNPLIDANVFPYEYRTIPSVLSSSLASGPTLFGGTSIKFRTNPLQGYSFSARYVATGFWYQRTPLIAIALESQVLAQPGNNILHSGNDWMVDLSKINFTPPYSNSYPNIDSATQNGSISITAGGKPALAIGDETFYETMVFDVSVICSADSATTYIADSEAYVTSPGKFYSCSNADSVIDGSPNTRYLTVPNPNFVVALNLPGSGYPAINFNSVDNLITLSASNYYASTVPNVFFYIKVSSGGTSTLPAGVSVGNFTVVDSVTGLIDTILPTIITSGTDTFWGYKIPNGSIPFSIPGTGGKNIHVRLNFSSCASEGMQLNLPVYYTWSCDGYPTGVATGNKCSPGNNSVTIRYLVPQVNLFSQITASASYSTCKPIAVTATLFSQELGAVGFLKAFTTLSNNFMIDTNHVTVKIILSGLTVDSALVPHSSVTQTLIGSQTKWTIDISSLTGFTAASLVGTGGLNNSSGYMVFNFFIIPKCNAPQLPDSIRLYMNGWNYCNLNNYNPSSLGDNNDTFPLKIVPSASGTSFNGCGPYISLAPINVTCFDNANGKINATVSVSVYDTTYFPRPAYTYVWHPTGGSGTGLPPSPLTPLAPVSDTLTVTDTINHCTATAVAVVTQPALLTDSITKINASIFGCTNGTATVYPLGGNGGYTYTWNTSPVQHTATATQLSGGTTYKVTITDSKGCTKTDSVVFPPVTPPIITGSSFICTGATTILDAGAGYSSYVWSTTDNTETISATTAGTYTVTVTKSSCTATASFTLSTTPLPDPVTTITGFEMCSIDTSISSDKANAPFTLDQSKPCTQVCSGSSSRIAVTLSTPGDSVTVTIVGGTKTYNAGLSTSGLKVYDVVWGSPGQGSITVEETYLGGCSRLRSFCIDILSSPKALFGIIGFNSASGTVEVCGNNAIAFSDSSNMFVAGSNAIYANITSWNWNFGDNTGSNLQNPLHTYTSPGTYTVTLTVSSSCNCTSKDSLTVKVDSATAMDIQCPSVICNNGSATYTVSGCSNVNWSCVGGNITAHAATTATITWNSVGSSGFGYVSASPVSCQTCKLPVTVRIPVITHNAPVSGPTTICVNNDSYYNIPIWPGAKYTWSLVNLSPNPSASIVAYTNENRVLVRATGNGQFKLKVSYTDPIASCSDSSYITVNVVSKIVDSASPAVGCVNNMVRFTLSAGATSQFVIVDPNGVPTTLASANSVTYTPLIPGNYTVDVTSANVCIDTPLTYHVDATPHVLDSLITGPQSVCRNTPYTYIADVPAPTGTQYTWSIPNASDGSIVGSNIGNSVIVKWTNTAYAAICTLSISAQSTVNLTCVDTTSKKFLVTLIEPNPAFNIPLTVCANAVSSAISAVSISEDYYAWSFTPSNLASCVSGYEHSTSPLVQFNNVTSPTTVTVRLTVTRCNKTVFKDSALTINPAPTVTLNHVSTTCTGTSITFTATPSVSDPAATYMWTMSDGTVRYTNTTNTLTYTYGLPATYWVHVTTTFPTYCNAQVTSANDSFLIIQASAVTLAPVAPATATICPPGPVSVPMVMTPATYVSSAVWTDNGSTVATGVSTYTATSLGLYQVQITDANGCVSRSALNVHNCPVSPPSCPGVNFTNQNVTVACGDIITAGLNYTIPIGSGYSFSSESWSFDQSQYIVPGSGTVTSMQGTPSSSTDVFQVNHSGNFVLTYTVYLNVPGGGITSCQTTFSVNVPLHIDERSSIHCNGTNSGYTLSFADNSDYIGAAPTAYQWSVSPAISGTSSFTGTAVTTGTATPGQIYTVTYTVVKPGISPNCSVTFYDTVPASVPSAAFSYIDSPLVVGINRNRLCEGFSIRLQPTTAQNTNWIYHWHDNHDGADIIAYNPAKEYNFNFVTGSGVNPSSISLTVTDNFGCSASATSINSTITKNLVDGRVGPHSTLVQGENAVYWCPSGGTVTFNYEVTGSGVPTQWKWYYASNPSTILATTATYTNNTGPAGRYLCLVTDADGCQAISGAISPTMAGTIQTLPMPSVGIDAKRNYCVGDSVYLKATPVPHMSYSWTIGSMHYTAGPNWTVTGLAAGIDTVKLTYIDTFAGTGSPSVTCSGSAAPFIFTVYALPTVTALIDTTNITCDPYSVGLTATGTAGLTSYTWSTGAVTQSTHVTTGGDYRVWLTGPGACTSHADIHVPEDPAVLLQYAPYGCYTYTCDNLTSTGIELDGPPNTTFKSWSWNAEGTAISGHTGANSAVVAYVAHYTGDYSLSVYDGVDTLHSKCSRTSPLMHISASPVPCPSRCNMHPSVSIADCSARGIFAVTITLTNSVYGGATYNLTSPSGTFTGTSPSTLPSGANTIHTTYNANIGVTGRVQMIITMIYPTGTCQDTVSFILPTCTKMASASPAEEDAAAVDGIMMRLMPNPASDRVSVVYSTGATNDSIPTGEVLSLSLADISGQEIESLPLATVSGLVTIDVSSLASGLYFVTLRRDHTPLATGKLMVISR